MPYARISQTVGRAVIPMTCLLLTACDTNSWCGTDPGQSPTTDSCENQAILPVAVTDEPSDAPAFAGLWHLYSKTDPPRFLGRLLCDDSGDPLEFQDNPTLAALLPLVSNSDSLPGYDVDSQTDPDDPITLSTPTCTQLHGLPSPAFCVHLDGQPHAAGGGKIYRATVLATQDGNELHVIIQVDVFVAAAPTGSASDSEAEESGNVGASDDTGTTLDRRTVTFEFDAILTGIEELEEAIAIAEAADDPPAGVIIDSAHGTLHRSGSPFNEPDSGSVEAVAIRSILY